MTCNHQVILKEVVASKSKESDIIQKALWAGYEQTVKARTLNCRECRDLKDREEIQAANAASSKSKYFSVFDNIFGGQS